MVATVKSRTVVEFASGNNDIISAKGSAHDNS